MTNFSSGALDKACQIHTYFARKPSNLSVVDDIRKFFCAGNKKLQIALKTPTTKCLYQSLQISIGENVFIWHQFVSTELKTVKLSFFVVTTVAVSINSIMGTLCWL